MNGRKGFTLLEVIVALALMGSVLVGSLLAFSSHRSQLSMAEKRIEATRIADDLVSRLSSSQGGMPVGVRGTIAGKPNWVWQTSSVGTTTLATVQLQVLRLQILELSSTTTQLVAVELVKLEETR